MGFGLRTLSDLYTIGRDVGSRCILVTCGLQTGHDVQLINPSLLNSFYFVILTETDGEEK